MEFINQYLTHKEYTELGGQLQEMPFNLLELRARIIIDDYTSRRLIHLKEQKQEVKLCVYEIIETINKYQQAYENRDLSIASTNTDGYSESYNKEDKESQKANRIKINDIVYTYLSELRLADGTPYLYRR